VRSPGPLSLPASVSVYRLPDLGCAQRASEGLGYGNLKLSPEQHAMFVEELPQVFVPIRGGWGKMGMTRIRLAAANEDVLAGALCELSFAPSKVRAIRRKPLASMDTSLPFNRQNYAQTAEASLAKILPPTRKSGLPMHAAWSLHGEKNFRAKKRRSALRSPRGRNRRQRR
jgi:hypothetical protein